MDTNSNFLKIVTRPLRWYYSLQRLLRPISKKFSRITVAEQTYTRGVWENSPIVQTKYGKLRGRKDKHNTFSWRGVPYAQPPVGKFRWKAPLAPQPWEGIRNARRFGSSSAQIIMLLGPMGFEDCLFLNVWRPATEMKKLPVYVFIHGGGNSIGTSASKDLYGHVVASRSNMVYISVNYRLGAMGWFRYPPITGSGTPEDQSGNYGTLDLIMALRWIQENIEAFGGDPDCVTISGESAGAMNVMSLMISPLAKGLFHRAISQSGIAITYGTEAAERQGENMILNLLVRDKKARGTEQAKALLQQMDNLELQNYLYSKSALAILDSVPKVVMGMAEWGTIYNDGTVVHKDGYKAFEDGNWPNRVPLIIGVNKDEMKLFNYLSRNPRPGTDLYEQVSRYQSLAWKVVGLDKVAIAYTDHENAPELYAYRFDWGSVKEGQSVLMGNLASGLGAHHYAEVPFFLGTSRSELTMLLGRIYTRENRVGRENLITLILKFLSNFARTGNPNAEDLPEWMTWNKEKEPKGIVLDADNKNTRIDYFSDVISLQDIKDLILSELDEQEAESMLKRLDRAAPFGINEDYIF